MTNKIIKCPKCGAEYHPAEVFYPDWFFGHPRDIIKNDKGKIEFSDSDMNLSEEYTCDYCGCTFNVASTIDFTSEINKEHDFSDDYTSKIYANRLNLEEPSSK